MLRLREHGGVADVRGEQDWTQAYWERLRPPSRNFGGLSAARNLPIRLSCCRAFDRTAVSAWSTGAAMHLLALTFRSSAERNRAKSDMANGWTSDGTSVRPDLRDGRGNHRGHAQRGSAE